MPLPWLLSQRFFWLDALHGTVALLHALEPYAWPTALVTLLWPLRNNLAARDIHFKYKQVEISLSRVLELAKEVSEKIAVEEKDSTRGIQGKILSIRKKEGPDK